jgi:hypothetical protein
LANHQLDELRLELAKHQAKTAAVTKQLQTVQIQGLADQKRWRDLRQALIQADDDASTRLGQLGEKYWAIIDHFIPPTSE